MFGPKLFIKTKNIGVNLVPGKKEYAEMFADWGSSAKAHMFSGGPYGMTKEDEEGMYDSMKDNRRSVLWVLIPEGEDKPIGYTAIHNITYDGTCTSEIMISNRDWWGKGMASQSHIARLWYAAKHLNRSIVKASVAEPNEASIKALKSVGYFETGKRLRTYFRNGKYYDDLQFAWINPDRVSDLYPEGLPEEYSEYVDKAKEILEIGDKEVNLL